MFASFQSKVDKQRSERQNSRDAEKNLRHFQTVQSQEVLDTRRFILGLKKGHQQSIQLNLNKKSSLNLSKSRQRRHFTNQISSANHRVGIKAPKIEYQDSYLKIVDKEKSKSKRRGDLS